MQTFLLAAGDAGGASDGEAFFGFLIILGLCVLIAKAFSKGRGWNVSGRITPR